MEIQQTAPFGVTIKFPEGSVAVNPPKKGKKTKAPDIALNTWAVPIEGWSEVFEPEEGQKMFLGPGEYEKGGIYAQGFNCGAKTDDGARATAWRVESSDARALVLVDADEKDALLRFIAETGSSEVVIPFCDRAGKNRMSSADIMSVAATAQARIIMPIGDDEEAKSRVAKEAGDSEEAAGKWIMRKKDIAGEGARVVLIR